MKKNSCYNCIDRTLGCHSTCEKYAQFQDEQKALREKVKEAKLHASTFSPEVQKITMRATKRKGGK